MNADDLKSAEARYLKPVHYLTDIDHTARQGVCSVCGPTYLKHIGRDAQGRGRFRCYNAWNVQNSGRSRGRKSPNGYRAYRKDHCERPACTTTIEDPCQLDVHHIDGNRRNNDPANLQTLCASCHRLAFRSTRAIRAAYHDR